MDPDYALDSGEDSDSKNEMGEVGSKGNVRNVNVHECQLVY